MEYYSAIKRNKFESVLMRWTDLEPIMQTEVSQKERTENDKHRVSIRRVLRVSGIRNHVFKFSEGRERDI